MTIDPSKGDLDWDVDTDVADFYGITKWEPPLVCNSGDAEREHNWFHKYTDIEHFANYHTAFVEGEEVVITEKIHGKNCRMGLVMEADKSGESQWTWMAGSHDVRRKQFARKTRRMDAIELFQEGYISAPEVALDQVVDKNGLLWKVIEIQEDEDPKEGKEPRKLFIGVQVDKDGNEVQVESEYWMFLTDNVRNALTWVRASMGRLGEATQSVILYGEIFGSGVQDMTYGFSNGHRSLRVFDIALNGEYLDYDQKVRVCQMFNLTMVPHLYKGPYSRKIVEDLTDGPTTACDPKVAGKFKGREGCVIAPVKERFSDVIGKRCILKSVSADYLGRKDAEDNDN